VVTGGKYIPDALLYLFLYSWDESAPPRVRVSPGAGDPPQRLPYVDAPMYVHPRGRWGLSIIPSVSSSFIVIDVFIPPLVAIAVSMIARGTGISLNFYVCSLLSFFLTSAGQIPWGKRFPSREEGWIYKASTLVADRPCQNVLVYYIYDPRLYAFVFHPWNPWMILTWCPSLNDFDRF